LTWFLTGDRGRCEHDACRDMLVAAGRRAPVDAELEDRVDDDVFLDSSPLKPLIDRSAAQPEAVDHSRAVKAFQQPALLLMFDSSSQENPAAWVTRCAHFYQSAAACVVQRAGHRTLSVLDVDCVVPLKVRQLRCVVHGRSGPGVNDTSSCPRPPSSSRSATSASSCSRASSP
jgi:hypothetical protein